MPGHWEGDLILGLGSSAIRRTLRSARRASLCCLYLPRMAGHGHEARVKNGPALAGHGCAEAVRDAISRTIVTLPGSNCAGR